MLKPSFFLFGYVLLLCLSYNFPLLILLFWYFFVLKLLVANIITEIYLFKTKAALLHSIAWKVAGNGRRQLRNHVMNSWHLSLVKGCACHEFVALIQCFKLIFFNFVVYVVVVQSPFDAFLIQRNLKTLAVRQTLYQRLGSVRIPRIPPQGEQCLSLPPPPTKRIYTELCWIVPL